MRRKGSWGERDRARASSYQIPETAIVDPEVRGLIRKASLKDALIQTNPRPSSDVKSFLACHFAVFLFAGIPPCVRLRLGLQDLSVYIIGALVALVDVLGMRL